MKAIEPVQESQGWEGGLAPALLPPTRGPIEKGSRLYTYCLLPIVIQSCLSSLRLWRRTARSLIQSAVENHLDFHAAILRATSG